MMYTSTLPYSCEAPQWPGLPLSATTRLPPPALEVSQLIQPYLADIATAAAIEIQTKVQQSPNPLRIFMFNQMAANNYANADFMSLVQGICDYLAAQIYQTNNQNAVLQMLPRHVEDLVTMYAANNARLFPELFQKLQPQQQMDVQNTQRNFDMVGMQVQTIKQTIQQRSMQTQGQAHPGATRLMTGYISPFGNSPTNAPGMGGMGGGGNAGMLTPSTQAFFGSGSPPTVAQRPFAANDRWSNNNTTQQQTNQGQTVQQPFTPSNRFSQAGVQPQATTPAVQVQTTPQPTVQSNEPVLIPAEGNENLWRPSEGNSYLPAYDPRKFELFFQQDPDGTLKPALKKRDPNVDYDRHSTRTIFGILPTAVTPSDPSKVIEQIDSGVTQLAKDLAATRDDQYDKYEATHVKKGVIAEISEESAIFVGAFDRLVNSTGEIPHVFRAYARVASPIVSFMDDENAIQQFATCKTFAELRENMLMGVEAMSQHGWLACHNKITAAINRVLKQNLSLPSLSIDSFADDIGDLIALLGNKYGGAVQEAFLKHQGDVIRATFQLMYEDSAKEMTAVYKGETQFPEGKEPKIAYLSSDLTLTYLNCLSHELDINMLPLVAATVTEDLTPMLYKVVFNLFKDVRAKGNDFDRHLIITNDGRQLEATVGWLGQDFYLVTVVK